MPNNVTGTEYKTPSLIDAIESPGVSDPTTMTSALDDSDVDDGGRSGGLARMVVTSDMALDIESDAYTDILHYSNIFGNDLDLHNKDYRFGYFNGSNTATRVKEYLFFTKPDLNIYYTEDDRTKFSPDYKPDTGRLNTALAGQWYWKELLSDRKRIINQLQLSANKDGDNFNHLLQNSVISNLEIPPLSAETIDTPQNMYGVGFSYRGSSEASDDSFDFSLEFKDTKWLDVYYFFKTYEEYETLKHHGIIRPQRKYIESKILHDQFSIYKFLVDEDMETILYYCKYYGVMPKSLPRDVFSSASFDSGLSYSIEFKAAFFEDMRPEILFDFNDISRDFYNSRKYQIEVYNPILGHVDNRPAQAAYVEMQPSTKSPNGHVFKLRWRGSDQI